MIHVLATEASRFRAFGWVQDPSKLRSLCDVVAVFDPDSPLHEAVKQRISRLVHANDGQVHLLEALAQRPLQLQYSDLVGTSFTPRSASRCNGIVQAAVKGQVREFIGDWPADNFVRWAHAFGFLSYDYTGDHFSITEDGARLSRARTHGGPLNPQEKEILLEAALAYPPAVRILTLLSPDGAHLTKYELGRQLGFVGEAGFTSLPQSVLIRALATQTDPGERSKMKADWDGSSDKYARMIAKWLIQLELVEQLPKTVTVQCGNQAYTETIGHAYMITAAGIAALNRAKGRSRHRRIPKNVCYEMLATKGADREYLRTRRTYLLKAISERSPITLPALQDYLHQQGITATPDTIADDIEGLQSIGLDIRLQGDTCTFQDTLRDFILPRPQALTPSDVTALKDSLRPRLTHLRHDYLCLVDLAYDSAQNRLFEMKVMELLTEACALQGTHLGGSRKPDGAAWLPGHYGILVDTKAYSGGYNLPISQADEMERYVRENQTRDPLVNPNRWWERFPDDLTEFYFLFVSGHFIGGFASQLERVSRNTHVNGGAVSIAALLLLANGILAGTVQPEELPALLFQNGEYTTA